MRTLLVVDDQEIFRAPIGQALRARGFHVLEAPDGPSALRLASEQRIHLALIDVRMPEMDGIDVIRALQMHARSATFPVILMTAQARREDIDRGAALGIRDFLLKSSFSLNELVERIERRIAPEVPPPPPPPTALDLLEALPEPPYDPRSPAAPFAPLSSRPAHAPASSGGPPSVSPASHFVNAHTGLVERTDSLALPESVLALLELAVEENLDGNAVVRAIRGSPDLHAALAEAWELSGDERHRGADRADALLEELEPGEMVRLAVGRALVAATTSESGAHDLDGIRTHGIATAVLAGLIAPAQERLTAFLEGLLHVLPAVLGVHCLGKDWPEVAARTRRQGKTGVDGLAMAFGFPTGVFADSILSRLRVPDALASVVREWHRDSHRRGSKAASLACRRLDAAASLATGLGFAWSDLSCVRPITSDEMATWSPLLSGETSIHGARQEILHRLRAAKLPLPAPPPSKVGGCLYWRDSRFRSPDPVELALGWHGGRTLASPQAMLLAPDEAASVACSDPCSPWWPDLTGSTHPLLVIHTGPAPIQGIKEGVRTLQEPIPLHMLNGALERMSRRNRLR